jgi:hypothetical protein
MVTSFTDFTTSPQVNRDVLKITVPKGAYSDKELQKLYNDIKDQVGNYYLPIIVPDGVNLEIIV